MKISKIISLSKLTLPLLFSSALAFGQAPIIQWEKTYGGTFGEYAYSIIQTQDGGYAMVGNVESYDGDFTGDAPVGADTTSSTSKMGILKIDAQGNIQWHKLIKSVENQDGPLIFPNDYAYAVIQNSDGDYLVAGGGGGSDPSSVQITKISSTGVVLDTMSIGAGDGTMARDIHQTYDGGYIVAGIGDADAHYPGGMVLHDPQYGSSENSSIDWWILKLDANLDIQWQKDFGSVFGTNSAGYDQLYSCVQTPDSGFVFAGSTGGGYNYDVPQGNTTDEGYSDAWIIKTDKNGNILWNKVYGGGWYDEATSIKTTFDHGFIVGGYYKENSGDLSSLPLTEGSWIFKLDSLGNMEWQKGIEAMGYSTSFVIQTKDSDYVLTTRKSGPDYKIVKFDQSGNEIWEGSYGGTSWDEPSDIQQTNDGGYILVGSSNSEDGDVTGLHGDYDFWVVKLDAGVAGISQESKATSIKVFPNPADNRVNFSKAMNVKIFSLSGKLLLCQNNTKQVDISNLSSGSYILQFYDKQEVVIQHNIIVKK